jgi:transposase
MKRYGEEFKEEAVALAKEIGVKEAGQKLNVSEKTLYGWRKGKGHAQSRTSVEATEARVKQLEKEIDELRRANEILKKAMGFLAR